jgi:hypothetical protein
MVTVHTIPVTEPQPVQDKKLFAPEVEGAVRVTLAPELYDRAKLVIPDELPFLSTGVTAMATPLAGLAEVTVRV